MSPSMAGVLTVSETFKHARAAFLDPITTSRAHYLTLAFVRRTIKGCFNLHSCPYLKHHARDNFNTDKFNATEPARPQIVVQNPGRVLVGNRDCGQLASLSQTCWTVTQQQKKKKSSLLTSHKRLHISNFASRIKCDSANRHNMIVMTQVQNEFSLQEQHHM